MSSGTKPDDLDERWRRTFGSKDDKPWIDEPIPPAANDRLVSIDDVFALLDREAEKYRLNGDLITAELFELVRAKLRVLERL
jgi:hypothetical protein